LTLRNWSRGLKLNFQRYLETGPQGIIWAQAAYRSACCVTGRPSDTEAYKAFLLASMPGIWTCGENFHGPVASFASGAIDDPFAQLLRSPGLPGKGASRLDPRSDAATHQRASRLLAAELLGKEPAETKTIIDTQVRKSGF